MKNIILSGLFLLFVFGIFSISAFAQDNARAMEGTWRLEGVTPGTNGNPGVSWFLEWTFAADGMFLQTGYPPLSQKGKYRLVQIIGDKITLKLYEQSGNFGTKDKQIEILIDAEKDTLKIDGKAGFKRSKKQKSE